LGDNGRVLCSTPSPDFVFMCGAVMHSFSCWGVSYLVQIELCFLRILFFFYFRNRLDKFYFLVFSRAGAFCRGAQSIVACLCGGEGARDVCRRGRSPHRETTDCTHAPDKNGSRQGAAETRHVLTHTCRASTSAFADGLLWSRGVVLL